MGSSRQEKAASHERIVATASAHLRESGLEALRVDQVMSEAGLTHGGFYRHFNSRDELINEALGHALNNGSAVAQSAAQTLGENALKAIIVGYLSPSHRDSPSTGCAVAALAEDMSRAKVEPRELYQEQVKRYLELFEALASRIEKEKVNSKLSVLTLSALVGAVNISRATSDEELSLRILNETRDVLLQIYELKN